MLILDFVKVIRNIKGVEMGKVSTSQSRIKVIFVFAFHQTGLDAT